MTLPDEFTDAKARLVLRAFVSPKGNILPFVSYNGLGLAALRLQCTRVELADGVSEALSLDWIKLDGLRGFVLTASGREAISVFGH